MEQGTGLESGRTARERRARALLIALLGLALAAAASIHFVLAPEQPSLAEGDKLRMPVANPPLEPSRPDLFEEPRIDDPPQ